MNGITLSSQSPGVFGKRKNSTAKTNPIKIVSLFISLGTQLHKEIEGKNFASHVNDLYEAVDKITTLISENDQDHAAEALPVLIALKKQSAVCKPLQATRDG